MFYNNYAKQLDFNRTVSEITTAKEIAICDALMQKYPSNSYYGIVWNSDQIDELGPWTHLNLSGNYGYLKINGFLNSINLSEISDEKKDICYDEPFFSY